MYNHYSTETVQQNNVEELLESGCQLIVWNDDINTFDWVIESLITICNHSAEQAEQSALFIHYKGKYAVKKGSYEQLTPCKNALIERGINATLA